MMHNVEKKIAKFFSGAAGTVAVFLFGSVVRKCAGRNSDVDIAVLYLPTEVTPGLREHLKLVDRLTALIGYPVDLVALNTADPVLKIQVFEKGRCILEKDRLHTRRFIARSIIEYIDLSYNRGIVEHAFYKKLSARG